MDILWFLSRRLEFISTIYDGSTKTFVETMSKIQAGQEPYVDTRDPEYSDGEPAFLEEYQEAKEAVEVIGYWSLCMIQGAFKAYLEAYVSDFEASYRNHFGSLKKLLAQKRGNWFERYKSLLKEELLIDMDLGPVDVSKLEEINLTRDDLTHNIDLMSNYVYQTPYHRAKHPKSAYTDSTWRSWGLGETFKIGREELSRSIDLLDRVCSWLDDVRTNYLSHVQQQKEGFAKSEEAFSDDAKGSLTSEDKGGGSKP